MLFETNINTILVVDDDPQNLSLFTEYVRKMGLEPEGFLDSREALTRFSASPCPIVITDMVMPGLDGIGLLKEIKKISPLTEVIVISGFQDLDLAVDIFRCQASDFISKPVPYASLEISINRAREKLHNTKGLLDYTESLEQIIARKNMVPEAVSTDTSGYNALKTLLNSLPLVVFVIDRDFRITALNNMYKKTFGDHTGCFCYQIDRNYESPCKGCPALDVFSKKNAASAEIDYICRSGDETSTLVWAAPVREDSCEAMIVAADVSKVKSVNDHLTELGLMVGSVSHGIKGMLTGLDGGVYVLDSALKKHDETQAEKGLEMLRKVTSRMKNMVLDILFYTKERELRIDEVKAASFADDLIKIVLSKSEKRSVRLYHLPVPETLVFKADLAVLTPAVVNILENALDACIADIDKDLHEVSLEIKEKGDSVLIVVSDNGIGIKQAELPSIFKIFKSGKGRKGTGLGLFIADKAIKQHGGTISVESEKGVGTTFIITLPGY